MGMGADFYQSSSTYRTLIDTAPVDFDMAHMSYDSDEATLAQTQITQPCMTAMAVGITDLLAQKGIRPAMAAGLSLGEYGALYAAGVLDAQTVIALTAFRGAAMTAAAQGIDCGMYAILGVERDTLATWCGDVKAVGVAQIANCNCPGQIVISGEQAAVDAVAARAKTEGKRALPLKVSGPFHTAFMQPAGDALREKFATVDFHPMQVPVVFNCTGKTLQDGESIPDLLEKQVQSTVFFEDCVQTMLENGVEAFVEVGAGKVLAGFLRRINRSIPVYPCATMADIEQLCAVVNHAENAQKES